MRTSFPLFRSHLELAHSYWDQLLLSHDTVIDATCGNGHDTLKLSQLVKEGMLYAFDIQESAIDSTKNLLKANLKPDAWHHVHLEQRSHATFPAEILNQTVKLIVYNLGYLPGGDKSITTLTSSTLQSIENGLKLIIPGGALCITCYPGHPEGAVEQDALMSLVKNLDPKSWNCCLHTFVNRNASPRLLLIQRAESSPDKGLTQRTQRR
jgi:ribosomal protein L11 methylase PrmA